MTIDPLGPVHKGRLAPNRTPIPMASAAADVGDREAPRRADRPMQQRAESGFAHPAHAR